MGLRSVQDDEQDVLRTLWNEVNNEGLGQRAMSCAFARNTLHQFLIGSTLGQAQAHLATFPEFTPRAAPWQLRLRVIKPHRCFTR